MNQRYAQQPTGFYPPAPHSATPPFQLSPSDVTENTSKGAPAVAQNYHRSPKPSQGAPQPVQPPYRDDDPPTGTYARSGPPPTGNPTGLTDRMSDASLSDRHCRAASANFPPPPPTSSVGNGNFAPPDANGFEAPAARSPSDVGASRDDPSRQPSGMPGYPQVPGQSLRQATNRSDVAPMRQQHQPPQPMRDDSAFPVHPAESVSQYSMNNQQYQGAMHQYGGNNAAPVAPTVRSPQQVLPPPNMGYGNPVSVGAPQRGPTTPGQAVNYAPSPQRSGPFLPGQEVSPGATQHRQPPQRYAVPPSGQPVGRQPPSLVPPAYQQQQAQLDPYGQRPGGIGLAGGPYPGNLGGPQAQQQQQQQQQQAARRLDPDQMPSPIQVMQDDERSRGGLFATNQKGLVPPLVTTKYTTQDQGNSSPRFIRSTMYTVPTSNDTMKQTGVPFGLILSPMAQVAEGEYEPPIVDMGEIGPVRCVRCKAYMGPFVQFVDAGRRFQCPFCRATSQVPQEYFQHLDHTGQRMDRYERPELMLGTYEYTATTDYCRNNLLPKAPAVIFLIDVSYNNVKSGLLSLLCSEMKRIIRNLPIDAGQERTAMKVGFVTYNNTVHFYNVNACLTQPQMMVVGDVQDVFMPLLDGFLCDPEESELVVDALVSQIPRMFADTRETETVLAPAIRAGLEALKASDRPGKLIVFHSSLPIAEAPGKLKNRDERKVLGTEKEKTVLAPQTNVYNNLGQECVAVGCSVDLFVFNNSYVDVATIGQICRLTGGEIYKYTYFQADTDGERLVTDIVNNISRPIAFDAVMRVRTSTGVRATDFYGHFFMSNTTDMELAAIDCNKAVAIEIKHDDKLGDDEGVYVQAALLYTSCGGVRRLRIINLSLRTSSQMAELYRACDLDAIVNFFSKQSVFKLIESSPKSVKDNLVARCATILAAYRKHCASPSSAGQLILPECMKLLPLYVNCLLKSDALSGGADMTIDDRSYVMQAVATMPLYTSVIYFYPRLLPLHSIDPQASKLPQQLRCSFDKFMDDGAYLLENGIHMFLWLGLALSSDWLSQVFGVMLVDTDRTTLPVLDTPLNKRIRDIIARVRAERHHCMRLTIVRQREKLEMVLRHFLVEDRGNDGSPSYVDFLCHMHKEIKTLLSQ